MQRSPGGILSPELLLSFTANILCVAPLLWLRGTLVARCLKIVLHVLLVLGDEARGGAHVSVGSRDLLEAVVQLGDHLDAFVSVLDDAFEEDSLALGVRILLETAA